MCNAENICYIKNRYFLLYKKAASKHCTQNYFKKLPQNIVEKNQKVYCIKKY